MVEVPADSRSSDGASTLASLLRGVGLRVSMRPVTARWNQEAPLVLWSRERGRLPGWIDESRASNQGGLLGIREGPAPRSLDSVNARCERAPGVASVANS